MEECAELIQAISKEKRGKIDRDNMTEEIADVLICIEMLKQMYMISEDLLLTFQHRAGVRLYTSTFIFAQPCVFVKQLPGPILCALSCEEGPFIPKLQGQFA